MELYVNQELNKVYDWLTANKLTLNIKKSNFIIFCFAQRKLTYQPNIVIFDNKQNKMALEHKDYVKYLLIDKNLSLKHHIDHIIIKLSRTVRLNAILRHFLLTHTLLCQALMPPYLTYGLKVWGSGQFAEYGRIRRDLARAEPFIAACNETENSRVQPSVHGVAVVTLLHVRR